MDKAPVDKAPRDKAPRDKAPGDRPPPRDKAPRPPDRKGTAAPGRPVSHDSPAASRGGMPNTSPHPVDPVPTAHARRLPMPAVPVTPNVARGKQGATAPAPDSARAAAPARTSSHASGPPRGPTRIPPRMPSPMPPDRRVTMATIRRLVPPMAASFIARTASGRPSGPPRRGRSTTTRTGMGRMPRRAPCGCMATMPS